MWLQAATLLLTAAASICSCEELQLQQPEKLFSRPGVDTAGGCSSLLLDQNAASLYVGCRGFLAKLWAYNINDTAENVATSRTFVVSSREESECRTLASASECAPSVRQIFLRPTADTLLVCSSVALKPELRVLDANKLIDKEEPRTVIGLCSPDARVNGTAVHVEWGNPGGDAPAFYAGIRTGMAGENHLIYRPALMDAGRESVAAMRTIYTDNTWLNEPQFVASFDIGEYVYFFFREIAVEIGFAPPTVFSRVARVCKKDMGGRAVLRNVWTSYVKARLNCSISARFPFYFDHLQSVSRVELEGDTLFYASMSTQDAAFPTSAICVFALSSIDQLFGHGLFLEQHTTGVWLPAPADSVPSHRPGSCSANSSSLSDNDLHFAKSHLMMAEPVSGGVPVMPTRDVFFHSVLVDVLPEQNVIFAIDHRSGWLWKLAHWREGGEYRWSMLQKNRLEVGGARIMATAILPHEFLYVSTSASTVGQFSLAACHLHASCHSCAIDPFCSWSSAGATCARREKAKGTGWISSWAGRGWSECASAAAVEKTVYLGDALHLESTRDEDPKEKGWTKDGRSLTRSDVIADSNGGIVIMNVRQEDGGEYVRGTRRYRVIVDTECERPTTVAGYHSAHREYCKEMASAKTMIDQWETCNGARGVNPAMNLV
ncbi:hypothetical protein PFISCL1PPCAC_4577 [Pristionchus fissidentatus]|uniref:Sema domain-containing protein n=1 Tax=Pristionchus fissidentatus TaxID=1538716 RepID=A0AAV5V154_9BILA|nr:hypothetical protein PFISCL1PPCAC_4577 [Pristionchus fissidentatus]